MAKISIKDVSLNIPVTEIISIKRCIYSFFTKKNASEHKKKALFPALKDINLEIREGDRVGLVGLNGSGKTTLLRTLAGIYPPSFGSVHIEGKIMNLLNITGGSHPDLTGFENIKALLTFKKVHKAEQKRLIPLIAEFTELGEHLNKPIKNYSAGMGMRLCFAVATSIDSEILLMDEWLSVGDLPFLNKAQDKIGKLVNSSKIVVFGSHNLELLEKVTNKTIYIKDGSIVDYDATPKVLSNYRKQNG